MTSFNVMYTFHAFASCNLCFFGVATYVQDTRILARIRVSWTQVVGTTRGQVIWSQAFMQSVTTLLPLNTNRRVRVKRI
jgi:hypothetical protein